MLDKTVDARDFALLENDRYTFAVLDRVLRGECRLILTDHERLIVCHSADPYPVWIWTPDGLSTEEKARAWDIVREYCPVTAYSINLKYELAEYFAERAKEEGINAGITLNMYAYDCPAPKAPDVVPDGGVYKCGPEDMDEAADIFRMFNGELGLYQGDPDICVRMAKDMIDGGRLYLWKTSDGRTAASCGCNITGDGLGSINAVYTFPEMRRKHYAENLVYAVTNIVAEAGAMPMLYTNADYIASNACYEKIGYVLRGKLCTFGMKAEG